MTSLQKELRHFTYSATASQDLINIISKQFVGPLSPGLVDKRNFNSITQKELQRINAQRYADGFKLSQKSSNPQLIFRANDYVVSSHGFGLSTNAFLVSIQLIGDKQQVQYWRDQVLKGKSIGAYGQTELGHGSNVKQLETVAIYNEQKDSFTINSPTITSAKFWPGVLGQYCTHSIIQAKTFVKGKNLGVQTFVIELRNEKLQTLKNIQLFDIGPKLSFERVDNGGLFMKSLQIPRRAMLMRYVKVHKDGTVEGLQNTQAIKYGYGSMLNLRVKLTYSFALGSIIFPATNLYEILNKQGLSNIQSNKKFLIDIFCLGYGLIIANRNTHNIFNQFLSNIQSKDYKKADKNLITCHIISSSFKALSSRMGVDVALQMQTFDKISKFRTSNIPAHFFSYIPSTTYEGDNTVLFQQTAKFLLFKFDTDKEIKGTKKIFKSSDWNSAALALQNVVAQKLKNIKENIEKHGQNGLQFQKIWNEKQQVSLVEVSNLWAYMTLLKSISIILPQIKNNTDFYHKICSGFTSYIVSKLNVWDIYGFTVQHVQTWKSFSDIQFEAMRSLLPPTQSELEPMKFIPREGKWLKAKL